jgi:hypothetical protein
MSMLMTRAVRGCAAALMAAVLAPAPAFAQPVAQPPAPADERRPYRGIFGGPTEASQGHSLTFEAAIFAAYDDNMLDSVSGGRARDWRYQRSGRYAGATGAAHYAASRPGERVSFGARSDALVQYSRWGDDSHTAAYFIGGLNMDARLSGSTTLSAAQGAAYVPGYSFSLSSWPGDGPLGQETLGEEPLMGVDVAVGPDLEVVRLESFHLNSRVALTQQLSRGTSLTGGYGFRRIDFGGDEDQSGSRFADYGTHYGFARLGYQRGLTQYATLNLGYGIRVSDRNDRSGRPRALHDVQAGIGYGRPLSISRRTTFRFSTGSAIAVREDVSLPDRNQRTTARLTGDASLVHELGRTWTARASYRRGLTFREGFDEFFFTDSLGADVEGLVTRRLAFSAAGAWAFARLDRPGRSRQTAFSGSARATYALNRHLALYTRYLYYEYEFGEGVPLDERFPRALERHSLLVGLTTRVSRIR